MAHGRDAGAGRPTPPARRPARWRGAARAGGVALLALAAAGCLFDPRSAETPGGQNIVYIPAINPAAVMENLETALEARDAAGYTEMLADDFRYVADGQTTSEYPDIDWANWDRAKEAQYVGDMFNSITAMTAALRDSTIFAPNTGTEVEWELIYTLEVTSPGAAQATPYRGRAFFKMGLFGSFWALSEWRDIQGEPPRGGGGTLPTSGILRGAIARGGG